MTLKLQENPDYFLNRLERRLVEGDVGGWLRVPGLLPALAFGFRLPRRLPREVTFLPLTSSVSACRRDKLSAQKDRSVSATISVIHNFK